MRPDPRIRRACGAALAALAVALGACGDDAGESPAGADGAAPAVSVEQIDGIGPVLVDDRGAALYAADQEADGTIRCTGGCLRFWLPLEAGDGTPAGSDDVTGELGTVARPDGARQITYDGEPLYRFSEDPGPGQVAGDGLTDEFGGRSFTWHAVTADGAPAGDDAGSDGRGYGY